MGTEAIEERGPKNDPGQPDLAERDRRLLDFLKILRLAFKMATIYNQDHPTFKRTVDELMVSLEAVFQFFSPLIIGFSPNSLLIGEQFWGGDKTTTELAHLFHYRKIKRLEIYRGLTNRELLRFISRLTRPIQELIRQGGVQALLREENFVHLKLEILDYSQLLQGEGEEIKDIWPYLLMEAVAEDNSKKLDQLAGSFEKVIGHLNTEDLVQNEELHRNFIQFFHHLRETAQDKYSRCAKKFLKSLMAARKIPAESRLENLKQAISSLSDKDLASTLWEEVIGNEKFDSMSFSIFARIIDRDRHKTISTTLKELFTSDEPRNRQPEVEKKIKALLYGTSGQLLTDIYRQTLANLLSEISFEKQICFDHQQLKRNYRFILLNLLLQDKQQETARIYLQRILEEWPAITEENDLEFMQSLLTVLQKKADELAAEPDYDKVHSQLSEHIEDLVLKGETQLELDALIMQLPKSIHDPEVYLRRIFLEKQVSATMLKAFFRFFPTYLPDFLEKLGRRSGDSLLLEKIVAGLRTVDLPASLTILKKIFQVADQKIKLQTLRAMHQLSEIDEAFLFPILNLKDRQLKAEALVLLQRYDRTRHVAFTKLFNITSPYGIRNKKLIQHIQIVEEKNLREARPFLLQLARRKDFWNRRVRQEARRLLEKWDEG
ncbi:MAG: hypothetical protein ACPLRA_04300 [Candidatus Saccharicenans sp.]